MTTQELDKMTPEEKEIAIAELCGYEPSPSGAWYGLSGGDLEPPIVSGFKDGLITPLPDYLNSLDAITSACRDHITNKVKHAEFSESLIQILNRKFDGQHRFLGATPFHVATAEPDDLCNAFLMTMLP